MYSTKKPRRKAGLSLWDPRTAGGTMPEPIINHGYFVGTSGLGLWDPRTAGATMPEPRVNRAYIAGVVYDAARDDYPHLKNPPGISATSPTMAGLGGYGRGCGCGSLPSMPCPCPRCCAGLPCRCGARSFNGLGSNEVRARNTWQQVPNPVIKPQASAPDLDPTTITEAEVVGFRRPPAQTRVAVKVLRNGFEYWVDPNALPQNVFTANAAGINAVLARVTPELIESERKTVKAATAESARQNQLDRAWQAAFEERTSLLNLLAREARGLADKAGAAVGLAIPTWAKVAAGAIVVGFAANIYLNYLKTKQLMLKAKSLGE